MKFTKSKFKMWSFFVIAAGLLILGLFAQSAAAQVEPEASPINGLTETFVDLLGEVNYTYYSDGSQYEGKTLSLHNNDLESNTLEHGTMQFALSIGAYHVFYYEFEDGTIPGTIEDLYRDDIVTHVLYADDPRVSDETKVNSEIDAGIELLSDYDGANNNLTVDTLDVGETEEEFTLAEMIANTSSAHLDSSTITPAAEAKYAPYRSDLIGWSKTDDLVVDEQDETVDDPVTETYGTNNMTSTVYVWLARYIEVNLGVDAYTIDIDDGTENVTSEGMTVMMDAEYQETVREMIDQELDEAGVDGFGALSLRGIGSKVSKGLSKTGKFAFSAGMSTASLAKKAATSVGKTGYRAGKAVVGAAISTGNAVYQGGKYVAKGTAKAANFVVDSGGKVVKGSFGFLGSVVEGVKKAVSFILKYWWLWLTLLVIGFVLFATPVGPMLMNNTIRKIVK